MSRTVRLVKSGLVLHVTARGNYGNDVFHSPGDRAEYLHLLARHAATEALKLLGWCLMTNHVHLLVIPERDDSLARTMKRTQGDYARLTNRRHLRAAGHLWQSRFYSCPLQGDAVWTALRYIERNPVRAGIVDAAEASNWSSAAFHCGVAPAPAFLDAEAWSQCWDAPRWRTVLALGEDERLAQTLREATQRGFPVGDLDFLEQWQRETSRDFTLRPPGRPPLRRTKERGKAVKLAQGLTP